MTIQVYPTSISGLPKSSITLLFSTNTPGGVPSNVASRTEFYYSLNVPAGPVVLQANDTSLRVYPGDVGSGTGKYFTSSSGPDQQVMDENRTTSNTIGVVVSSAWATISTFATSAASITSMASGGDFITVGIGPQTGATGRVQTTTNGTSWTARTIGSGTSDRTFALNMYDGTYYYVSNLNDGAIYVSTNTSTWATRFAPGVSVSNGLYAPGAPYPYVMASNLSNSANIYISTNGTTWTTRTFTNNINEIIWASPYYLGGTDVGHIVLSTDGLNWTTRQANVSGNSIHSVIAKPPYYYAFTSSAVRISTNFTTWASSPSVFSGSASRVVYDGANYMVVFGGADEVIKSSTDGTNWVTRSLGQSATFALGVYTTTTKGFFALKQPVTGSVAGTNSILPSGYISSWSAMKFDAYGASNA